LSREAKGALQTSRADVTESDNVTNVNVGDIFPLEYHTTNSFMAHNLVFMLDGVQRIRVADTTADNGHGD
jgi:hypothetical protein